MSYNPYILNGSTGVADSTPVVIAANQAYYLPVVHGGVGSSNYVSGATTMGGIAAQSHTPIQLITGAVGSYIYVTSVQAYSAFNFTLALWASTNGSSFTPLTYITFPANSGFALTFPAPIRLPISASLYFGPVTSSLGATGPAAAQVIYVSAQGNSFTV